MRVIAIVGSRNCGSTLLDAILGNAPGARSLGEVGGFHRYRTASACACGEPPAGCVACTAVRNALDIGGCTAELDRRGPGPLKERRLHWAVVGTRGRAEYARVADLVFDAVAAATGSEVLIDSSKNIGRAAALVHDSRHDVRIVHLVRDGRGYLASRRRRAEASGSRHRPAPAMGEWMAKNVAASVLLRPPLGPERYLLCRYEDLVRDPDGELRRIGGFAGLDTSGLAEAASGPGVPRQHLFEPPRRVDYRTVRLDRRRLEGQRRSPAANAGYWWCGGVVSALWGYDRAQSYLQADQQAVR